MMHGLAVNARLYVCSCSHSHFIYYPTAYQSQAGLTGAIADFFRAGGSAGEAARSDAAATEQQAAVHR